MKKIQLTQLQVAFVDDSDYEWLVGMGSWFAHFHPSYAGGGRFMADRKAKRADGKRTNIYMHRAIMDAQPGEYVDHVDGNPLNNQRDNLRPSTKSQNAMNTGRRSQNTSGLRGVSWHKAKQKWRARIQVECKAIHLGYFDSLEEASTCHEAAREKHFGQYNRRLATAGPQCHEGKGMRYVVIAKSPAGGAWLESTHRCREDAETEAERLNRLPLPFEYVVAERTA